MSKFMNIYDTVVMMESSLSGIKASDWETLISFYGNKSIGVEEEENLKLCGVAVGSDVYNNIFDPKFFDVYSAFGDYVGKQVGEKTERIGGVIYPVTNFWSKYSGKPTTSSKPKTDIKNTKFI